MRTKLTVLSIFLLSISISCKTGQELGTETQNRVVLNKSDTIYQFYTIKPTGRKPKVKESSYYYWFRADTILVTRKGFDGKLLHGDYKAFYPNKNLKESGQFEYGLKNGEWKAWFSNGELQSVSNWRAGKRQGKFQEFSPNGQKLKASQYKEDKLSGDINPADTVANKVRTRNAQPVIKKEKSDTSEKKSKKKSRNAVQK
jgi:hypothetical protein